MAGQYGDRLYDVKITIPAKPAWTFQEPMKFYVDIDAEYWKLNEKDASNVTHAKTQFRYFGSRPDKEDAWQHRQPRHESRRRRGHRDRRQGRGWLANQVPFLEKLDSQPQRPQLRTAQGLRDARERPRPRQRDLDAVAHRRPRSLRGVPRWLVAAHAGVLPQGATTGRRPAPNFSNAANHRTATSRMAACATPPGRGRPRRRATGSPTRFHRQGWQGRRRDPRVAKQKSRRGEWAIVRLQVRGRRRTRR